MPVVDSLIVINDLEHPKKAASSAVWLASNILSIILAVIVMATVLIEVKDSEHLSGFVNVCVLYLHLLQRTFPFYVSAAYISWLDLPKCVSLYVYVYHIYLLCVCLAECRQWQW